MDTESLFYKYYFKYFLWNDALIEHFFKKGDQKILLNVDHLLLRDIGNALGLQCDDDNYVLDFFKTVEDFCRNYTKYISVKSECPSTENERGRCTKCKSCEYKKITRTDYLAVANHIKDLTYYKRDIEQRIQSCDRKAIKQQLPFFAIIIYILLKLDNGTTQQWDNVEDCTTSTSRRTCIEEIWNEINRIDPRFDRNASVYVRSESRYQDHIGKLLYHLPLSASTRNKIQDAIYKSSAWKYVDTKSYWDLLRLIRRSLKDQDANKVLNKIFDNKSDQITTRKIQAVIDEFDIDAYELRLASRENEGDYNDTVISGEFALGLFFPSTNNPDAEISFMLLTTIQQYVKELAFEIKEGGVGTLAGYNRSPVIVNGSTSVCFKEYQLGGSRKKINIVPLPFEDVVFFREYNHKPNGECLYIQTREITPADSYFIAVKNSVKDRFKAWCDKNANNVTTVEGTESLFGNEWIVYYTEETLRGQLYDKKSGNSSTESTDQVIIMKGGIKSKSNAYFINALPYFEIPEEYVIEDIQISIRLNDEEQLQEGDKFKKYIIGRKIIIDLLGMPIGSDEIANMNVSLEYLDEKISYKISICAQPVIYDVEHFYKYNNWGMICESDKYSYSANDVDEQYRSNNSTGLFHIVVEPLNITDDNLYFTNLLAAQSYDSNKLEITDYMFNKCIGYATTRLGIDVEQDRFINNTKRFISQAGIINIDYNQNKYQAIPPTFMRVPFSIYGTPQSQMIMLCGCYTRSFIADLQTYCNENGIKTYSIKHNECQRNNAEALLPPIILLGHNFNPNEFCEVYHQNCKFLEYDYALSLLNILPCSDEIKSSFSFNYDDDRLFLNLLSDPKDNNFPRLRLRNNGRRGRSWYIEKKESNFAQVPIGYDTWASLYCHHMIGSPLVVLNDRNSEVLIPSSLWLPNYVQRALYLMNLGLPKQRKVFICDTDSDDYYTIMKEYHLKSKDRCEILADKITGGDDRLKRYSVRSKFEMHFWTEKRVGRMSRKNYLVLKNNGNVIAIVHNRNVYLNDNGIYKRVYSHTPTSMNKIISFLIKENWQFSKPHDSIGYRKNYGAVEYEKVYDLKEENIELPNENNYEDSIIQII